MINPFRGTGRARDKPGNIISNAPFFGFGRSFAEASVTPKSALTLPVVYACVRVIAETIASLPFGLYMQTKEGSEKATEHQLWRLLHDEPNPEMTSFTFRETMMTHLLTYGNSYSQKIYNMRGELTGLYPLLPSNMDVDRDGDGKLVYTYTGTNGQRTKLEAWQVLHIPGLGFDGVMGYSPIAMEKNAIGLGLAAEEYGSKFFGNGAIPSGILTHPNHVKDPAKLRDAWNKAYGGSGNANKVAVLEEGMSFQRVTIPNNEAQFLETRRFQTEEICRIFRVPPHMIGNLEHATFSNIEHQSIDFAVHTIRPWCVRIEQACNKSLLTRQEAGRFYTSINLDGLMRGSYKERMEGYSIGIQNGFLSPNDVRALENMNPIPKEQGGDTYITNGTMKPLKQAATETGDDE